MNEPTRTLMQKAYQAFKEFLVIAIYLWLVFAVLLLYKSVILGENIGFVAHGIALFNALALAKVMLIAKELRFAEQFRDRPLIYPTIFKSICFALILGCFKVLEEASVGWYHGRSFTDSVVGIGGGTIKGILSLILVLAVLLIPFFGYTELSNVFGEGKLRTLFFHSRHTDSISS
jgi:hypothetical protein